MQRYTVQLTWADKHTTDVVVTAQNIHKAAETARQLYTVLCGATPTIHTIRRVREDLYTSGMYELLGPL